MRDHLSLVHTGRLTMMLLAALMGLAAPARVSAQVFVQLTSVDASEGGSTHESMLAAGPTYILHFTPAFVDFYNRNNPPALVTSHPINTFFAPAPNGTSGDPVAYYDATYGRYLLFVMGNSVGTNDVKLWISKGGGADPTQIANWWKYVIPAPSGRDYVGLGVSGNKIALVWNGTTSNLRLLDRAKAYDSLYTGGEPLTYDMTVDFGTKVCRNLSTDTTLHLVRRNGNAIEYRTITGPASSATLSGATSVAIPADPSFGATAFQPDTSAWNTLCEPRQLEYSYPQSEVYMRNGRIAMAWTNANGYDDGSPGVRAVRCIRFQTSNGTLTDDFQIGRPGIHYAYPSVAEDAQGTLFVGYDRFSPNEYPSCYMVARNGNHQSPEYLIKSGTATYMGCLTKNGCSAGSVGRWGDYTSMIVDEFAGASNYSTARFAGGWTSAPLATDNAIGSMIAVYGTATISGLVQSDSSGVRTPRAGAPVVLRSGSLPVDSTTTSASGTFSFGQLPAGTFTVHLAWPDSVALQAIAGSGGASQTVLTPRDIQVVINDGQTSSGNQLVVRLQPSPAISSLSATQVHNTDADFDLVVNGVNFKPWSQVLVDGRPKTVTYGSTTQVTARVKHYDIARSGIHTVAVVTPAAAGSGASQVVNVYSLPRFLASMSSPTMVVACPAGDAGRIQITAVAQNSSQCSFTAQNATATLYLIATDAPLARVWDATQLNPSFPIFSVTSAGVYDPGTGTKTFNFDVGKISQCSHFATSLAIGTAPGVLLPTIDVRSFDLSALAHGSVDRFDIDAFTALYNGTDRCGDFVPNGHVDGSDLAYIAQHNGHTAHTRLVISPNGGETYTRTPSSHPTIPIRWDSGCGGLPCGDSARVTVNLKDGANTMLVASNLPDNGAFDWNTYCNVLTSSNKKIEVIHTGGILRSGDVTIGSDQSDNPFTITGSCNSGGGGCPYLDTWVAGRWEEENSILGRSTTGALLSDVYRLTQAPEVTTDGTVKLRVREDEQERTRLASVALRTVDRSPDQESWVVDDRIVVGTRVPVARVRTANGADITKLVTVGGPGYEAGPGTVLLVDLWDTGKEPPVEGRRRGGVILLGGGKEFDEGLQSGPIANNDRLQTGPIASTDAMVLNGTGIRVEVPDSRGQWSQAVRWYPRAKDGELSTITGAQLRLVFIGRHRISQIQWMRIDEDKPVAAMTPAATASHSERGEVAKLLAGAGDEEVTLSPGENLALAFSVPPIPEGKVRDYYFAARGVYTTLSPTEGTQPSTLPKQLALLPARPNPTGGAVRMGFALPAPSRVRFTVYDPMGRMVVRLVDGQREAGTHELTWDLKDRSGRRVSAGIYFYRMEVGSWKQERRVTVR